MVEGEQMRFFFSHFHNTRTLDHPKKLISRIDSGHMKEHAFCHTMHF